VNVLRWNPVTDEMARDGRQFYALGESVQDLAWKWRVNPAELRAAVIGLTHHHLPGAVPERPEPVPHTPLVRVLLSTVPKPDPHSSNYRVRTPEEKIRAIRADYADGAVTMDELAKRHGVCRATAWKYARGGGG
jgi:hypothetical protein